MSDGVETSAQQLMQKLKIRFDQSDIDVRWSPVENLHVTLGFIGEVESAKIKNISEQLLQIAKLHSTFELKLQGCKAFPDLLSARVVFTGVQRSQALLDLQSSVESSLSISEDRDYQPHLTLGRLRNPQAVRKIISPFARQKLGKILVSEIALFESVRHGPHSTYTPIEVFRLG